jgi:hypothetical protein
MVLRTVWDHAPLIRCCHDCIFSARGTFQLLTGEGTVYAVQRIVWISTLRCSVTPALRKAVASFELTGKRGVGAPDARIVR